MTYRELLEQYKNGQLKDSEKERVEADIERQDAISEYLYENGSIPDFDDLTPDTLNSSSMEKDDASSAETGMIMPTAIMVQRIPLINLFFIFFFLPNTFFVVFARSHF